MKRANLGAGGVVAPGWTNVERGAGKHEHHYDMRYGLRFKADELDYAVANHVCSMFEPVDLRLFLTECKRVLRPGGVLRVIDADLAAAARAAEDGDLGWFDCVGEWAAPGLLERFACWVTLNGARRSLLTAQVMAETLREAKFVASPADYATTVCDDPAIMDLDSRPGESFIIEGIA